MKMWSTIAECKKTTIFSRNFDITLEKKFEKHYTILVSLMSNGKKNYTNKILY